MWFQWFNMDSIRYLKHFLKVQINGHSRVLFLFHSSHTYITKLFHWIVCLKTHVYLNSIFAIENRAFLLKIEHAFRSNECISTFFGYENTSYAIYMQIIRSIFKLDYVGIFWFHFRKKKFERLQLRRVNGNEKKERKLPKNK